MASEVDICNLALTHIRSQPDVISINPAEGGVKAEQCALYFGKARRYVLRSHVWSFANTYRALALLDETPINGWTYVYAMPSDCLRPVHLFSPDSTEPQRFERGIIDDTQVIYCDIETPTLRYVKDVTDPNAFDSQFIMALSFYLASLLAMPITGDIGLADVMNNRYLMYAAQSAATSAYETNPKTTYTASWISAR